MKEIKLSTQSYKGVRDFYPEDAAVQDYIFTTWSKTAKAFGFARFDASLLELAELYKAKGAENAEMVNEQTYTFIDRGEREVTLRPEMTPSVARMIAAKKRDLQFPVRWYSIPNLFRYERPQRGRLREHWQLNCDIFGGDELAGDIESIALAHQLLLDFGAAPKMFEVRVNNRQEMRSLYENLGIKDPATQNKITQLNDRFHKLPRAEYCTQLEALIGADTAQKVLALLENPESSLATRELVNGLFELGITNVKIDRSLARGFNYYTGTIFEIFDVSGENNRSLLGGGRYDNLTALFSEDSVSGVGFGMGDVTMRDFLETHALLEGRVKSIAPTLVIIPADPSHNLAALKIAQVFRQREISTAVDTGEKKLGKKISDAAGASILYALVVGQDELQSNTYTLKNLPQSTSEEGTLDTLLTSLIVAL